MENKKAIQEELEELSPLLASLKKEEKQWEDVPVNYFDNLEDEVWNKITPPQKEVNTATTHSASWPDQIIVFIQSLFQPSYALALASVVVLIAAFFWLQTNTSENSDQMADGSEIEIQELALEDIQMYVDANIDDIEESDLYEILDENVTLDGLFQNSEDADLDEYLDELLEDTDLETLEELL